MESWGANGVFAARYASQWARAGAGTPGRRIRCRVLPVACVVVAMLLGSLALGSYVMGDDASQLGAGGPAVVFAAEPGEPARIPALDQGLAPFGGADRPLDQRPSGEPSGDDELMVDVRRALEQLASAS